MITIQMQLGTSQRYCRACGCKNFEIDDDYIRDKEQDVLVTCRDCGQWVATITGIDIDVLREVTVNTDDELGVNDAIL